MSPAVDIIVNRDKDNDILYVIKRDFEHSQTVNIHITADVIVRLDRSTHKIVGLTIEDFSLVFTDQKDSDEYHLMEYFDIVFSFLNDSRVLDSVR